MTLSDATDEFKRCFEGVTFDVKGQYYKDLPICWSGGQRKFEESAWALYSTRDAAIIQWLDYAKSLATGKRLKFIVLPELLEFQITIADKLGQHRAVNNRFAVKSQFVVSDD